MTYTSNSLANAYYLNIDELNVNPSGNYTRWYGFPVRCLVILVTKRPILSLTEIRVLGYTLIRLFYESLLSDSFFDYDIYGNFYEEKL